MVDFKNYDSLIALLDQERAIYEELALLLQEERAALRAMDASTLGEIVSRKETLSLRVKALDESRRVLASRLGRELALPAERVTVSGLSELAPPSLGAQLSESGRRLKSVVETCQAINKENESAASRGLELLSGAIEYLIKDVDPQGPIYSAPQTGARGAYGAQSGPARSAGPAFVSRQI